MEHTADRDAPFRCRLFGHRWEQTPVDGLWRFRCERCARVEGYCGQAGGPVLTPDAESERPCGGLNHGGLGHDCLPLVRPLPPGEGRA